MARRFDDVANHGEVVGDDDIAQGQGRLQRIHEVQDVALHRDVEPGGRLVGDDELGVQREGTRHGDAAGLPARQLVREAVDEAGREPDEGQQLLRLAATAVERDAVDHERLGQQRADLQPRTEGGHRILEHHGGVAAQGPIVGPALQAPAVERDGAGVVRNEAENAAGQRRLAGAGFANEADRFAGGDIETDVAQDIEIARAVREGGGPGAGQRKVDRQALGGEKRGRHGRASWQRAVMFAAKGD